MYRFFNSLEEGIVLVVCMCCVYVKESGRLGAFT